MDPTSIIYMAPAVTPISFNDGIEWAAWVQAVGSVAAIFFAVWLQNRQRKHDIADQKFSEAQMTRAVGVRVFLELKKARNEIMERLDLARKEGGRPTKFLVNGPRIFEIGTYPIIDEIFRSWEALNASPKSFQQVIHELRNYAFAMNFQYRNWEEMRAVDPSQVVPQFYIELYRDKLTALQDLVEASINIFEDVLKP